jgi:hypothetical protein
VINLLVITKVYVALLFKLGVKKPNIFYMSVDDWIDVARPTHRNPPPNQKP